jgi:hypothetical protein
MSLARAKSRSLFARRQELKRVVDNACVTIDPVALYEVEQCISGRCDEEPQCVSAQFIQALRDAAFALDVQYETVVAPHFFVLQPYERCVYTWTSANGGWCMLSFDDKTRALLVIVGASRVEKLVGAFAYNVCRERHAIRLTDVGPYSEMLLKPMTTSSTDLLLYIPDINVSMPLVNQTPQRLRSAA